MSYVLSHKEYLNCRNDLYTLIAFRNNTRVITYGSLSVSRLAEETIKYTGNNCVIKVYKNEDAPHTNSRDIADYL